MRNSPCAKVFLKWVQTALGKQGSSGILKVWKSFAVFKVPSRGLKKLKFSLTFLLVLFLFCSFFHSKKVQH